MLFVTQSSLALLLLAVLLGASGSRLTGLSGGATSLDFSSAGAFGGGLGGSNLLAEGGFINGALLAEMKQKTLSTPDVFTTPDHLRTYLKKLNAYYAIAGRPRFGKRSDSAPSSARVVKEELEARGRDDPSSSATKGTRYREEYDSGHQGSHSPHRRIFRPSQDMFYYYDY